MAAKRVKEAAATKDEAVTYATAGVLPTKASESELVCRNEASLDGEQKSMVACLDDWLRLGLFRLVHHRLSQQLVFIPDIYK